MKRIIFTSLFIIFAFLGIKAQETPETAKLISYTEWLAKTEKENRGFDGEYIKPSEKLAVTFKITSENLLNSKIITVIEIQTNSEKLIYQDFGGVGTAIMRYFVRITSKDRKFDSVLEEKLTIDEIPTSELSKSFPKIFPVLYRRNFNLPKGKYTFSFIIDNRGLHETKKKIKFEVK